MKQQYIPLHDQMSELISEWAESGQSLIDYSKKLDGISYEKMRYWKRKLQSSSLNVLTSLPDSPTNTSDFIPIDIPNPLTELEGFEILYPNQVKLNCPSHVSLSTLKTLINLF